MIKSFKHKGLEEFFLTGSTKGIQAEHSTKISSILILLNNLEVDMDLSSLDQPFFRLHKLKGNMKNLWSVTVRANWRITFEVDEITYDVYIVDYQDYH